MKVIIIQDSLHNSCNNQMLLDNLNIQTLGIFSTWIEAKPAIKRDPPDFLIIEMLLSNYEKGLSQIREQNDLMIPVIICSEYPGLARMDDAIDAGVIAFIPKSVEKVALAFQIRKLARELQESTYSRDYIIVKEKRKLIKIPFSTIWKIEISGNYSFLFMEPLKKYGIKLSLKRIMEKLDSSQFFRCHRSTIVNIRYLESLNLSENKILLTNNEWLDIGSKYKKDLKEAFLRK